MGIRGIFNSLFTKNTDRDLSFLPNKKLRIIPKLVCLFISLNQLLFLL